MKNLVTYNDAVEIIKENFDESKKTMYEIEKESGVSYYLLSLIKNNYKKPYPGAIIKLLKYFGFHAKRVMAFEIEDMQELDDGEKKTGESRLTRLLRQHSDKF